MTAKDLDRIAGAIIGACRGERGDIRELGDRAADLLSWVARLLAEKEVEIRDARQLLKPRKCAENPDATRPFGFETWEVVALGARR